MRGHGHNWEGTSGAAEADMLTEILAEVKQAGFDTTELITDKDSSVNAIYTATISPKTQLRTAEIIQQKRCIKTCRKYNVSRNSCRRQTASLQCRGVHV